MPSDAVGATDDRDVVLGRNLPPLPERLLLAQAEGRVLFIAGAGVSMQSPSCLPNFGQLVREVFASSDSALRAHVGAQPAGGGGVGPVDSLPPLDAQLRAMLQRLEQCEFDVALGMLERWIDRDQEKASIVREAVVRIIRRAHHHAPIHSALVQLANRGGAWTIATTNFDLLLERAARASRVPLRRYGLHDIPRPSLRPEFSGVLHLHGALDPNQIGQADLVLTDRDFGEHYLRRRAIPDLIYDASRIFHLVLVGYSLSDPPMRYLLNAVAADGQRFSDLKERFAFVGMKSPFDEAELATWKGRGITPIPFDAADDYHELTGIFSAWAALSPRGNGRAVTREVRRVLRLRRTAASEASATLFGHLFRRSAREEQAGIVETARDLRADPSWLDEMLRIVNERSAFGDAGVHVARLCRIAVDKRLTDGDMLRWAVALGPTRLNERAAVLEELQFSLNRQVPEPWRTAWYYVTEAFAAPPALMRQHDDYLLGQRLNEGDRSAALILAIAQQVSPRLKLEWRPGAPWLPQKRPKRPRSVDDLLHVSLVSGTVELGRALTLEAVTEVPFLCELAEALESEVIRGVQLGARTGWRQGRDLIWLGGLDRLRLRGTPSTDADLSHTGIAPAVHLLMHALGRLADLDATAARAFLDRWSTRDDPIHARMWAAAAVMPSLATPLEVARFLLARPSEQVWNAWPFPEIAELRAVRYRDLDVLDRDEVSGQILRGPPFSILRTRGPSDGRGRLRIGLIVRELTRIEAAGGELTQRALRWLAMRRTDVPEFVAGSVTVDFPSNELASVIDSPPDIALDHLNGEALVAAVEERLRNSDTAWFGPARAAWNWLEDAEKASRLARALLATDGHLEHYGKTWNLLGRRHRPPQKDDAVKTTPDETLSEARMLVDAVTRLAPSVLTEAAPGLAAWLGNWAANLVGEPRLPTAMKRVWPHAAESTQRSEADHTSNDGEDAAIREEGAEARRVGHDALNTPAGDLAGGLLAACPNLDRMPSPFADGTELRALRDMMANTEGYAGTIARYRLATALPYLIRADFAWTKEVLLQRLESGPETDILWHAVGYTRYAPNMMATVGRRMARRAALGGLDMEIRRSLVDRVCIAMLRSLWNGAPDTDLLPDTTQMLRSIPDDLRASAARSFGRCIRELVAKPTCASREDIFDRVIRRFLADVWPRERTIVTPSVARVLAAIPAACGRRFAEAVQVVRRFLVPIDAWTMHDWGLFKENYLTVWEDTITGPDEAAAALDLLDLTVGTSPDTRAPSGLDAVLGRLVAQAPVLRRDARFARLATLARH